MGRHEIVNANGVSRWVDDDGHILADGERLRVGIMMRDSMSPVQKAIADATTLDAARREFDDMCQRSYAVRAEAYYEMRRLMDYRAPPAVEVADGRRRHKVTSRDPQGRETGTAEWEEEDDAAGQYPSGQKAGDVCTINGAPGHLNAKLECVPDRQDARTMTADEGRALKDAAWNEMVAEMTEAWRGNRT